MTESTNDDGRTTLPPLPSPDMPSALGPVEPAGGTICLACDFASDVTHNGLCPVCGTPLEG